MLPFIVLSATTILLSGTAPVAGTVKSVADGDTLRVTTARGEVNIRILGIDCPESHHNAKCQRAGREACDAEVPKGLAAADRARRLMPVGTRVTIEPEPKGFKKDRYGRTLAYVRLPDGSDYGKKMLAEATCADFSFKYKHARANEYRRATLTQHRERAGLREQD